MKRHVYTNGDGSVAIVTPAPKVELEKILGPMSDAQYEAHVLSRSIPPDAINVTPIEDVDIPSDREFRDAWKQNNNKVDFDLPKAQNIQLERIRKAREPKFAELDAEFIVALEKNKDTTTIKARKQELRDATEAIKNITPTSIEDIKSAFPPFLRS